MNAEKDRPWCNRGVCRRVVGARNDGTTIRFSLPLRIEDVLAEMHQAASAAAKEAALAALYRRRRIIHHQTSEALGLHRTETDAVLTRRDFPIDLSVEELHAELAGIRRGVGG